MTALIANEPTVMTSPYLRILVLESHTFQRALAVSLFKQSGPVEVIEAANAQEALALLARCGPVDVVLCDLHLEGMDGLAFLQRAAEDDVVHSVIISGAYPVDVRRAIEQFVALLGLRLLGYVDKPVSLAMLENMLHRHQHHQLLPRQTPSPSPLQVDETAVREALDAGQFQAYYQPKFDLLTDQVCGVEVLARWEHPLHGLLSPAVFMPTLERCGLLDQWLLAQMHQALALQQHARTRGVALPLAFNLHTSQLASDGLSTRIRTLLARWRAPRFSVTFELTEGAILEASATSLESLVRLRMSGCNLSIDDFGAGFSSLQRLCQLPFNEIKLDGEFVRGLQDDPRCRAVIISTLALGKSLGMSVVVEGIETREQCQQLRELGCRVGQGYVFARPMTGEALLARLTEAA